MIKLRGRNGVCRVSSMVFGSMDKILRHDGAGCCLGADASKEKCNAQFVISMPKEISILHSD